MRWRRPAFVRETSPGFALEALATAGFERGVTPADLMRACYGARDAIDAAAPATLARGCHYPGSNGSHALIAVASLA
ncbi:hypothetical protein [Amycolatopsis eburnea]|uniref:Uncharacterized protein n=1 Tax=Amycolatopsis eburnea TaxID=2267691 RepID=A0A427SVS7_9PSEU|nr:hypothetical protein [Amycolatopsis eburnea]RSD08046.1 hypothetical protein EIY87_45570 [Amycolatopsis eburnea]